MTNDQVLHEARAWNWDWPDEKGRFYTNITSPSADASTRFTPLGPSKRTLAKRAAKRARRRGG